VGRPVPVQSRVDANCFLFFEEYAPREVRSVAVLDFSDFPTTVGGPPTAPPNLFFGVLLGFFGARVSGLEGHELRSEGRAAFFCVRSSIAPTRNIPDPPVRGNKLWGWCRQLDTKRWHPVCRA